MAYAPLSFATGIPDTTSLAPGMDLLKKISWGAAQPLRGSQRTYLSAYLGQSWRSVMWKPVLAATLATIVAVSTASAALPVGSRAPAFSADGALGGKTFHFVLKDALKRGPVVLYFFPAAFTSGCILEAHKFAEAADEFHNLGATVVGVTAGNINRIAEFSSVECRNKFPVLADPGARIARLYRSVAAAHDGSWSSRTSFVISPEGRVLLSYENANPELHVAKTMAVVRKLQRQG